MEINLNGETKPYTAVKKCLSLMTVMSRIGEIFVVKDMKQRHGRRKPQIIRPRRNKRISTFRKQNNKGEK